MSKRAANLNSFAVLLERRVWLTPVLLSALLLCADYSYLLFHTLAELFSITVGVLMFVVAMYTYKHVRDYFIMFLATGYFWVAGMDLVHTLLYKGMAIYPVDLANHSTQFWIANRYFESLLLLSAPFLGSRWLGNRSRFIVFGLIASTIYALIMSGYFPDAYLEGEGLTRFKIISEYIICLILVLALINLYYHQDQLKPGIFPFLTVSIVLTIFAELAFTNYISVYGPANFLGHIFKLFSFWLILYSIVRSSLQDPYEALDDSRALLQGLRVSIPDLIFYKDIHGVYLGCNQAFCQLIGKESEADVIGVTDFDLFDAELARFFRDKDSEMLESGISQQNDEWVTYPDGSKKLLDTLKTPFRDRAGKVIGLIGISRDITGTRLAEGRLRKLSQAVEQAVEAMMITDNNGTIEYTNPAFTRLTGYTADEVLGENPRVLKSGKQNGSLYPAMLTISPMLDDKGEITSYIGIQQDLSEYEMLEGQFYQSQKMEAVGTLVGGIAHDFNNTLAGITGNLYMAKRSAAALPDVVSRLTSVERLSFRASEMIQQLLTFSRKGTVQMNPIAIAPFLKEVIKLQQVTVPENISLTYHVRDISQMVNGDINLLQQVLINLINNARDAVEHAENPSIWIELEQIPVDDLFLGQYPDSTATELARITVRDNGRGMTPEVVEHIFEPFFTTKGVGRGTGLGLSMVFGAVQSHGGAIRVDSQPGQGTTFHLYLPLGQIPDTGELHAAGESALRGRGETILLVDDEAEVLTIGKDVLESLGYHVLTATDGLEAIDMYTAHRDEIDLLILDVVMPNMGGVPALQQIQELNPDVKALFATGYDKNNTLVQDGHISPDMMISKPYSIAQLSQAIRAILER